MYIRKVLDSQDVSSILRSQQYCVTLHLFHEAQCVFHPGTGKKKHRTWDNNISIEWKIQDIDKRHHCPSPCKGSYGNKMRLRKTLSVNCKWYPFMLRMYVYMEILSSNLNVLWMCLYLYIYISFNILYRDLPSAYSIVCPHGCMLDLQLSVGEQHSS